MVHAVHVRGVSQLQAGAEAGVSQQTVSRILKRTWAAASGGAEGGASAAELEDVPQRNVKRRSSGRPPLLTAEMAAHVRCEFAGDPWGGVGAVQKALLECGTSVAPRTLYRWAEQLNIGPRATSIYADLNERLIHGILNHIEAVRAALESGSLEHDNLVYADQTPI